MHRAWGIGLAIACAGLVAACTSDASLHVDVTHDPAIAAHVDHTVVSIYVQAGLSCAQIEFGDATDDQLAGALATEATDGQPLSGIPRVDPKVIVARGYELDNTLVSAGCVELGEVTGDQSVAIATVPTATVAVSVNVSDQRALVVATTDATNASIDGRAVDWRLFGAAGTTADASRYHVIGDGEWEAKKPTCTTGGDASIHPMPPLLPGGFALQLRVSWPTERPPLLASFTALDSTNLSIATVVSPSYVAPCALEKKTGVSTIACMDSETEVGLFSYDVPSRVLSKTNTQSLTAPGAGDTHFAGLIGIDEANGDRSVYAISNLGVWVPIDGAPPANPSSSWCQPGTMLRCDANHQTTALQVVPACGGSPAYLLSQSTDLLSSVHLRAMPIRGGAVTEFALKDGGIVGAGCITELQPDGTSKLRQAVVVDIAKTASTPAFSGVVFDCSATKSPCTVPLQSVGQAVGFTTTATGEAQLIGTLFDATGAQLARYVVEPVDTKTGVIGAKDRLIERSRQVAAAAPRQLVVGKFDADTEPDLLWTFTTRADVDFQIAYGREALGAPLSALTSIATPSGIVPQPVALFATDFNRDGYDELAFVFQTTVLTATNTSLVVVPTGVPYQNPPTPPDDPGCP